MIKLDKQKYLKIHYQGRLVVSIPEHPFWLRRKAWSIFRGGTWRKSAFKYGMKIFSNIQMLPLVSDLDTNPFRGSDSVFFSHLHGQIQKDLQTENLYIVITFPPQVTRKRFYATLFSATGNIEGFAKIVSGEHEKVFLRRECNMVRKIQKRSKVSFRVPEIKAEGAFDDHMYVVYEPVPARAVPIPWSAIDDVLPHIDDLQSVKHTAERLQDTSWWNDFLLYKNRGNAFFENLSDAYEPVDVSWSHGDFTVENILRYKNEFWMIDWENSATDAPVLTDRLTFYLNRYDRRLRKNPEKVFHRVVKQLLESPDKVSETGIQAALAFLISRDHEGAKICSKFLQDKINVYE